MKVLKRDASLDEFNKSKIENAILKAMKNGGVMKPKIAADIADEIEAEHVANGDEEVNIYDIEKEVFDKLISKKQKVTARAYEGFRAVREYQRENVNTTDNDLMELLKGESDYWSNENSNKNPILATTQRDYMAGIVSTDITRRFLLPPDIVQAHDDGIIHFHDADYEGQNAIHNCDLVNLEDMLQNGTVISEVMIDPPKSFATACTVATQAIAQIASSQYGGQSVTLSHLAPFVDVSRQKIRKQVIKELEELGVYNTVSAEKVDSIIEERVHKEVKDGIQTIQYQVVTLMTTNGQAPFITVFMYLDEVPEGRTRDDLALMIEETLKQRMLGTKNEKGVYVTPAFPKLIYVLDEDNIYKDSKYYYLTELAAKCSAKRLVPDYISAKVMKELKQDNVYTCMGCRSFLTVDRWSDKYGNIGKSKNFDKHKGHVYYSRFNQGVVTINLVDVACSSEKNMDTFWSLLDERLELCHRALRIRHERLLGTPSDVAPILWQHGALARLDKGETIDKLLYHGYSTISLGYAGLYECCMYMTGKSHTDPEAMPFALEVMQRLNDACNKWKAEEDIDYSTYGTPLESTTYKFAKCLKNRFGEIKDVTDHDYITNSYHVNVREEISAFDKLKFEAPFQKLSPGGAISYVEVPDMQNNIPAVLSVMQYIYNNIMYAELNTKSDYCMECGYDGEIKIIEDEETGKLIWECPNCKNRDQSKMSVARRTCGYIGSQFWNQGRTEEIKDRVLHL